MTNLLTTLFTDPGAQLTALVLTLIAIILAIPGIPLLAGLILDRLNRRRPKPTLEPEVEVVERKPIPPGIGVGL